MLRRIALMGAVVVMLAAAIPTYAVADTVDIEVAPAVLYLSSGGTWVTIHVAVPYADVVGYGVTIGGYGVPVAWDKADLNGDLVIKLRRSDVKALVTAPSVVTVAVEGTLSDGTAFDGSATTKVRQWDPQRQTRNRPNE